MLASVYLIIGRRTIEERMNAILKSTTDMCPKCRVIRNFVVNTERQQTRTEDGMVKPMEIVVTLCESCGSFISRESHEVVDQKP